jgi:hypothetical protein
VSDLTPSVVRGELALARQYRVLLERIAKLERAMKEAEWMVRGHVTGPKTHKIWRRYVDVLEEARREGKAS